MYHADPARHIIEAAGPASGRIPEEYTTLQVHWPGLTSWWSPLLDLDERCLALVS